MRRCLGKPEFLVHNREYPTPRGEKLTWSLSRVQRFFLCFVVHFLPRSEGKEKEGSVAMLEKLNA